MTTADLHTIATVLVFVAFAGICWWALTPSNQERFDEASRLPFDDEQK